MSDVNISFDCSPLVDFMSSGFSYPKEINVFPVCRIRETGDIYSIIGLNKNLCVTSLGMGFNKGKTLVTYVADSLRYNSLGVINISDDQIRENSKVAYSTSYDVYNGRTDLNNSYQPIIFTEIQLNTLEDLHDIIRKFRDTFTTKLSGVNEYNSNIVALVYMDCTSMFYLFRYTTWKIVDDRTHETHIFSVEDDGFPALEFITETYKCDTTKGEIPLTDKPDKDANRSPEIEFYDKIDQNLGIAFTAYSNAELSFMER